MSIKIKMTIILAAFLVISLEVQAQKRPELAKTAPMGWNSWNWFGKEDINEQIVKETIDAMATHGLRDAGYNYVVIDGGWRDNKLGSNGELLAHPTKFPHGIKVLADYAHSKGMKLGIHVVPGTLDCGKDPVGAFGYEEVHLKQFEDWGVDMIKLDQCLLTQDPCATCKKRPSGWSEETIKDTYWKWSQLLNNSDSNIMFSISAYRSRDWYPEMCNMARTTTDIQSRIVKAGAFFNPPDSHKVRASSVMGIAELNNTYAHAAGHGYWNDPDMLVVGDQGLSQNEQVSHFALWCVMTSPLFLGNDVRNMEAFEKELILNKEMIAINQDMTEQGRLIQNKDNTQVWAKKMIDGKVALLFLNLDRNGARKISLNLKDIGFNKKVSVRDVINHKDLGMFKKSIDQTAETNQCRFVVVSAL